MNFFCDILRKVIFTTYLFLICNPTAFAFSSHIENCKDVVTSVLPNLIIWHHLQCQNENHERQTINVLDIDLNTNQLKILPIKSSDNQLTTLDAIAANNSNVIAGINGGYFYNAEEHQNYKDPTCPSKTFPQPGDLGDSLIQVDHQVLSNACDADQKNHFARTAFVMDEEGHGYFQSISPEKPLKNLNRPNQSNVALAISGGPNLISQDAFGKSFINITEEGFNHLQLKKARTALAIAPNQHLYFVTVDAKAPNAGMTIFELAEFLLNNLHVSAAMNLDGGGSSTMCIQFQNHCVIVNEPSDATGARKIHDGLFIIRTDRMNH